MSKSAMKRDEIELGQFAWPPGISQDTAVATAKMMLTARHLTELGYHDLVIKATAHGMAAGGYRIKDGEDHE